MVWLKWIFHVYDANVDDGAAARRQYGLRTRHISGHSVP